jgi:CheY-like chemotaxis protein/anti-sigma regulatory factor (Ser/Thr protein kinase)
VPVAPLWGNDHDLRQTVFELVANAIDATSSPGHVTLRVEPDGDQLRLIVQDDGVGMTEDVVERCFEPFFTTQVGHARGLGLSLVHGTVRRHRGRVDVKSQPGDGTTVTLTLPVNRETPNDRAPASIDPQARSLRVLVVDDNQSVLTIADALLRSEGHVVDVARSGDEALALFRAGGYDVMLTDQAMPHLSGVQLAVVVKSMSPTLPIIMMTGYDLGEGEDDAFPSVDVVLRKPLTLASLQTAIIAATSKPSA